MAAASWLAAAGCGRDAPKPESGSAAKAALPAAKPEAATTPPTANGTPMHGATTAQPSAASDDAAVVPHGAELYGRMCAVCHGASGEGYKADQAPALGHPDFLASVDDKFLKFAIGWGRRGTTMSAWGLGQGGPLSEKDIAAIIAFMRSWQPQATLTLDDTPAHGNADRGMTVFKKSCERCHGSKGPFVRILNRQLLTFARPGFLRHAILKGRPPTQMPAFEQTLGVAGVEDVLAYMQSLPSWLNPGESPGTVPDPPIPLGPVPLNPTARNARGFRASPEMTSIAIIGPEYTKNARFAILDARAPSDYMEGHIAGAVSTPFYDPGPYLDDLPKDAWLVCYCGCPHAESGALARQLIAAGFKKVTVLDEGFNAWIAGGYPTHKGIKP